jgi:hypothetical protein
VTTIAAKDSSFEQSFQKSIGRRFGSKLCTVPSKIRNDGREGPLTPSVSPDGKPFRACGSTGRSTPDRALAR